MSEFNNIMNAFENAISEPDKDDENFDRTTLKVGMVIVLNHSFSGDFAKEGDELKIVGLTYLSGEEILHNMELRGKVFTEGQPVNVRVYQVYGIDGKLYHVWPEETYNGYIDVTKLKE